MEDTEGGAEPLAAPTVPSVPMSGILRSLPLGDRGLVEVGVALGPRDFLRIVTIVTEAEPS